MDGFDPEAVADRSDVPAGYEPVMIVTLGNSDDGATDVENERKTRRPAEAFVHHEELDLDGETRLAPTPSR